MYPASNSNPGFSTDYRGLLIAKITAKHEPSTGPLSGRPVYEWTEQQISATGGEQDVLSPRKGVYTSATQFDNCILDANDNDLVIDQFVWARMKGMVTGCTVYETVSIPTQNSPTSPPVSNCTSAAQSLDEADCLILYVLAGQNYCDNIVEATLQTTPFGANVWVANETIPLAGGAAGLLTVYKDGDDNYQIKIDVYDPGLIDTIIGKFVACVGLLSEYSFSDALLCDGDKARCEDNTFRVRFGCTPCPIVELPAGICDTACPDGAPGGYSFTLSGGTTDFAGLNGTWALIYAAGEWTASRGGWTATLTLVGTVATLRFEFDAFPTDLFVEYELNPRPEDCCDDIEPTLSTSNGTGTTPSDPTLAAMNACGPCIDPVLVCCCDPVEVPGVLTVTLGGVFGGYGYDDITLTWDAVESRWEGTGPAGTLGTPSVYLSCLGGPFPIPCIWFLTVDFGGAPCASTGTVASGGGSCSPFSQSFSAFIPAGSPPCTNAAGDWTAVVTEV